MEQESKEIAAANGITKVFIATPYSQISFEQGSPVLIYRKYNGNGSRMYKSVVTSFCTIVNQIDVCVNKQYAYDLKEFLALVGNKSVYDEQTLKKIYFSGKNIVVLAMLYNGYLGAGHNITYKRLKDGQYLTEYPYLMKISQQQFKEILEMGGKNVQNTIVN